MIVIINLSLKYGKNPIKESEWVSSISISTILLLLYLFQLIMAIDEFAESAVFIKHSIAAYLFDKRDID